MPFLESEIVYVKQNVFIYTNVFSFENILTVYRIIIYKPKLTRTKKIGPLYFLIGVFFQECVYTFEWIYVRLYGMFSDNEMKGVQILHSHLYYRLVSNSKYSLTYSIYFRVRTYIRGLKRR